MPATNEPFRVISFRPQDLAACQRLYREDVSGVKVADNDTGLDLDDIDAVYLHSAGNHFWVAETFANEIVGMIGVQHHDEGTGQIRRLRVASTHRRRGIGSALLERAIRHCLDNQFLKITLDTHVDHEPAIELFKKFRFRHDHDRTIAGKELMYFYLDLYYGAPARHKEDRGFNSAGT